MSEVLIAFSTLAAIMVLGFIGEIISKKIVVPSAILLVLLGIVCGPLLRLFKYEALVAAVPFISPLTIAFVCFEAGAEMNAYGVLRASRSAAVLSVLGFVFSVIPVVVLLRFGLGLDWGYAFMLATAWCGMNLIIANAVCNLLKLKEETRTTLTLLAMIDDPIVIISTLTILNYILLGGGGWSEIAGALMSNLSVSICAGALIGLAWLNLLYIARKTRFIYTFTLAAILFVYSLVEMLGGTGGIAIFIFGLIIGNYHSIITTLKLRLDKKRLSVIVRRIDGFHSEITFMLRSFFFTFLGLIYTFAGVTELLVGLAISILLHITRYITFKIGTARSPLRSDLPAIGLIVGQGVAAAAMSTMPLAYGLPNAAFYTSIALNVLLFTNILSISLPLLANKIVKKEKHAESRPRSRRPFKFSEVKRFLNVTHDGLAGLHKALYCSVVFFFKNLNREVRSKLPVWKMETETSEHVNSAIKVFKWVIFPASLCYVFADLYFFRQNALDSVLWGQLIFFYSNFLPDLPSIYRRKKNKRKTEDLPWYKRYTLLFFAALLIWNLFSGIRLGWKTTETFHNFKSLAIYGVFLLILGFLAFGDSSISIGDATEILSVPFYGIMGYLTHLKVDKIW